MKKQMVLFLLPAFLLGETNTSVQLNHSVLINSTLLHIFAGAIQGHNIYINCSKYENEPGEVFHPYRPINGSNQVDYCIECRCNEVFYILAIIKKITLKLIVLVSNGTV